LKPFPVALFLASLAFAAGCGSERSSRPPGPNEVVMTDYRFHPADATVKRGVELTVRNEGQVAHNLTVERDDGTHEKLIETDTFLTGESRKLRVDLSAGRYAIVCTVPGHEQRGMVGTLTVR
jgi:plastocyanin